MEIKSQILKSKDFIKKYKYALVILLIGLLLLLIPDKKETVVKQTTEISHNNIEIEAESLAEILENVEGAGRVQVLLSIAAGEKTLYQTNQDASVSAEHSTTKIETVIITDSNRNESGLISQTYPQTYKGAIVVCQGADSPSVRLAVTQAVARITGLGTDHICVLKMK